MKKFISQLIADKTEVTIIPRDESGEITIGIISAMDDGCIVVEYSPLFSDGTQQKFRLIRHLKDIVSIKYMVAEER